MIAAGSAVGIALLVVGVGVPVANAIGLARARDAFGRLHFLGPAAIFGPVALTLALAIELGPASPIVVRGGMIAALMIAIGPIIAHATARAARLRGRGTLDVHPDDAGAAR